MKRNILALAITSIAAMTATQVSAAIVGIDTFDDTFQRLEFITAQGAPVPAGTELFEESATAAGEAVGDYRDIFIRTDTELAFADRADATVVSSLGEVQVSNTSNASILVEFTWDGQDSSNNVDTNGLGGVDLTDGGLNDGILIGLQKTDQDVNLTFNLWDMNGATGSLGQQFQSDTFNQEVFLEYTSLSNPVDLANIGAIQLVVTGPDAYDLEFDLLQSTTLNPPTAVAAPATLALVSLGLVGMGLQRRRKADK